MTFWALCRTASYVTVFRPNGWSKGKLVKEPVRFQATFSWIPMVRNIVPLLGIPMLVTRFLFLCDWSILFALEYSSRLAETLGFRNCEPVYFSYSWIVLVPSRMWYFYFLWGDRGLGMTFFLRVKMLGSLQGLFFYLGWCDRKGYKIHWI